MKKTIIFSILLMMASVTAMAQTSASKVQHITYQEFIKKVWDFEKNPNNFIYKGKMPAIVDFYADWCGPCRMVAPIMDKLSQEFDGKLLVYKVNVDEEKALANIFEVRNIPTVLFIPKEGQPMKRIGAMQEQDYRRIVVEQLLK